uniref:Uncharacterized protein n=1 Tax=Arundo donax TaxID=35708 RepID=A0A0A9F985_ARUDO
MTILKMQTSLRALRTPSVPKSWSLLIDGHRLT